MLGETLRVYKMLIGEIEPDPNVHLLRMYYAYHGLADKYIASRSLDESFIGDEILCIIHGIYHSKEFALWCKDNLFEREYSIPQAVSSRMIMDDDLSFVHEDIYCIWYPKLASEETYRQLYRMNKSFAYQIARACAVGNYVELIKELNIKPEMSVLFEAYNCKSIEVYEYMHNKALESGIITYQMQDEYAMICLTREEKYTGVMASCCMTVLMMKELYSPIDRCWNEEGDISLDIDDMESCFLDYDILGDGVINDLKLQRKMNSIKKLL